MRTTCAPVQTYIGIATSYHKSCACHLHMLQVLHWSCVLIFLSVSFLPAPGWLWYPSQYLSVFGFQPPHDRPVCEASTKKNTFAFWRATKPTDSKLIARNHPFPNLGQKHCLQGDLAPLISGSGIDGAGSSSAKKGSFLPITMTIYDPLSSSVILVHAFLPVALKGTAPHEAGDLGWHAGGVVATFYVWKSLQPRTVFQCISYYSWLPDDFHTGWQCRFGLCFHCSLS